MQSNQPDTPSLRMKHMNVSARLRAWAVLSILACAPLVNRAAEEAAAPAPEKKSLPWEKGSVSFGGFAAAFDSTVSFGRSRTGGVSFNAEDLFDLDTSLTVLRVDAMYRPGSSLRHQVDFSYGAYHRSGSTTLSSDLTIGDITYPIGAKVDTVFNFDIIRGTYSYALLQDDRMRVSLGLGVYAVPLKVRIEGQTTGGHEAIEGANTTLPLPALALGGQFQLIPKLFLYTGVEAMYLEISDFKGSLLEANVGLEYRPWKHVGFGLGYNSMSVNVEGETTKSHYPGVDFLGKVGVRYSGLMLYGKFTF